MVLLLAFLAGINAHAQEGSGNVVLALTVPAEQAENETLENIIRDTVARELKLEQLAVKPGVNVENLPSAVELVVDGELVLDVVHDLASRTLSDFVMLSVYSWIGLDMTVVFHWYDAAEKSIKVETKKTRMDDLTLDNVLAKGVVAILKDPVVAARLAEVPPAPLAEELAGSSAEQVGKVGEVAEKPKVVSRDKSPTFQPDYIRPFERDNWPSLPRKFRHFELSAGFAPFIATGTASDYFKVGLLPTASIGLRFEVPPIGLLSFGLNFGINIFHAEGLIAASDNLLIPVGGDIRFVLGKEQPLGVFFHLAGGPAIFAVNSATGGSYTKTVLYALGGIGITISFVGAFGFGIEASYAVFFESAFPIMGFAPAAYFFLRL